MPNDLISTDPIVAQNFYLEIDGENIILSGVSGLDVEHDVVTIQQNGPSGHMEVVKTRGNVAKAADLSITRMAPADALADQDRDRRRELRLERGRQGDHHAGHRAPRPGQVGLSRPVSSLRTSYEF